MQAQSFLAWLDRVHDLYREIRRLNDRICDLAEQNRKLSYDNHRLRLALARHKIYRWEDDNG